MPDPAKLPATDPAARPRVYRQIMLLVLLLALLLGMQQIHQRLQTQARAAAVAQLRSVGALKASEIQRWLGDRRAFLAEPPGGLLAVNFARLQSAATADSDPARQLLLQRLAQMQSAQPELRSIRLLDTDGRVRLASRDELGRAHEVRAVPAREVVAARAARLVDLHRHEGKAGTVSVEIMVPLVAGSAAGDPVVGLALFVLDPARHLFPMIQAWPVPSDSAESYLARREGDEIVFLSPLRHDRAEPLTRRFRVDTPDLLVGRSVVSGEETVLGRDYRGVDSLGVVLAIPGTPWVLVSKVDRAEFEAPVRRTFAGIVVATLLSLGAMLALLRAQARAAGLAQDLARRDEIEQTRAALAESEQRYRVLFENSHTVMLIIDPGDGAIVDANAAACAYYGWSHATLLTMRIGQINDLPPAQVQAEMARAQAAERNYFEFRHRRADGSLREVEVFSGPIRIGGRSLLYSIVHDVSARRQAEAQLGKLSLAVEQSPESVVITNLAVEVEYVNATFVRTSGYSAAEVIGRNPGMLRSGRTPRSSYAEMWAALARGDSWQGEFFNRRKDGSEYVELARVSPIRQADGRITHYLAVKEDITERRRNSMRIDALLQINLLAGSLPEREFLSRGLAQAERATESEVAFLLFIAADQETAEQATWSAGTLARCVVAGATHLPVSQAGLWADALRTQRPVIVNDYAAAAGRTGLPAGHCPLQRLVAVPLLEEGRVPMLIGVGNRAVDYEQADVETLQLIGEDLWRVVRRYRADQAIKTALQQQRELNARLEAAQNQLLQSEKMASIGQLAAGVAHELNNPIGFVNSNLGTLEQYLKDIFEIAAACELAAASAANPADFARIEALKESKEFDYIKADIFQLMAESRDGLARVARIVQDLKDFSHAGEATAQWADLHQGLDSTLNIVWNELKYKCTVRKEYGELPPVWCMPAQLNQVFMNLLVNAGHAIADKGEICIRTGLQGDQVFVAISDTGSGIAPENLNRIFEPFFTTKPVGRGTGLGLSLAYSIVQKHRGHFEVRSELGRGTTFTVWLPRNPPEPVGAAGQT